MQNGVAFVMGPRRLALLLLVVAMCAGCSLGGSPGTARLSPIPSPTPSASQAASPPQPSTAAAPPVPKPVVGAYGVLVSNQSSSSYTISLVAVDGKIAASVQAGSTPPTPSCGGAAGTTGPLPISASNS